MPNDYSINTKWYDLNFVKVYNKMTNFTNPNERKKEMSFYTLKNFKSSYLLKMMLSLYMHFKHYSIADLEIVN